MKESEAIEVEDNGKKGQVVLYNNKQEAGKLTFFWKERGKFIIDHTEVGKEHGGKGYGKKLIEKIVEYARLKEAKVKPECPFAKAVLEKDDSFHDILDK